MTKQFELKREHIDLLLNAYVGWDDCEFGAPAIDCKRPYGNSNVLDDMAEILSLNADDDEAALVELHKGTRNALQILLTQAAVLVPGVYEAGDYSMDWKLTQ